MEFDITKMVEEIVMQAQENQEEFIFETIRPYCENVLQMKINKEELKQILLNSMQKQQQSEDCISRTALLSRIDAERKHLLDIKMDGAEHVIVHHARRIIEDMPSVTPTKPKGKWIQTKDDCDGVNFYDFSFECTECGKEQSFKSNYCPNCGAYMRESEVE